MVFVPYALQDFSLMLRDHTVRHVQRVSSAKTESNVAFVLLENIQVSILILVKVVLLVIMVCMEFVLLAKVASSRMATDLVANGAL